MEEALAFKSEMVLGNPEDEGNFDEFAIDDTLEPLERVKVYIKSDLILHRLHTLRDLADTAREIGHPSVEENLLPLLEEVKADPEPAIRQTLAEQIPDLFCFLKEGGDNSYKLAVDSLIPILAGYIVDINPQVRQAAMESLVELGNLLSLKDLIECVLPILKNLAKDNAEEEHRVQAAQLMNEMASQLGASLCEEFVIPNITALASDPMFRVRKAVASNIGNICTTIGTEKTTKYLLPIFTKLARDEIWGVRKACAESLVVLSQNLTMPERTQTLIPIFESLAEDMSRWVRNAAFQILGPFIATFPGSEVTSKLLSYYKSMAEEIGRDSKFGDSDNVYYCAFNFPAVLYTLGRDRWLELNDLYDHLAKDLQWKVRKTLSWSLHEVATILGTELTEKYLLSTFELFFKDLDEVKVGVVANLAKFLQILSPNKREQYLYFLTEIQKDSINWRFRKLLAKQMGDLSALYLGPYASQRTANNSNILSTQSNNLNNNNTAPSNSNATSLPQETKAGENDPFEVILSVTSGLLYDPVAAVRRALLRGIPKILNILECFPEKKRSLLVELKKLPAHSNYQIRQMFGTICLLSVDTLNPTTFESEFFPLLVTKYNDKVANVRLTFAKALKKLHENAKYHQNSQVIDALKVLQKDKDSDVIVSAGGNPPPKIKHSVSDSYLLAPSDSPTLKSVQTPKEHSPLNNPKILGFTLTIPQNKIKNQPAPFPATSQSNTNFSSTATNINTNTNNNTDIDTNINKTVVNTNNNTNTVSDSSIPHPNVIGNVTSQQKDIQKDVSNVTSNLNILSISTPSLTPLHVTPAAASTNSPNWNDTTTPVNN
jgi:serine/threonine-protein phosphatase 4 regulatory subunit 1